LYQKFEFDRIIARKLFEIDFIKFQESRMREVLFINTNQKTWTELEEAIKSFSSKTKKNTDNDTLHRLFFLYQTVCGHLSIARTRYGNTDTVEYLNSLVARAHQVIYVSKPKKISKIINFFFREYPIMLKKELPTFLISTGIFILSFLLSFLIVLLREDYALSFVPVEYADAIRNSDGSAASFNYSIASVAIFTNNIRVGITAFALGITFGIGTVYVLVKNGVLLGALSAVAVNAGIGYTYWSLIIPHGIPELFCIFVCGAAGLVIAKSIVFPGIYSRRKSFILGGKKSLMLFLGTIPLFILAGLTEGYFTPLPIDPLWKYIVAIVWLIILLIYILLPMS
jgi:uncharacterized membrane protein SpoIIM required for sporulation